MERDFNPNLNIPDPLAEIIEAEGTLHEFGAATAAMEFQTEQRQAEIDKIAKEEEAATAAENDQLLRERIAELEAQLAAQKSANTPSISAVQTAPAAVMAASATDEHPEIVDAENISDDDDDLTEVNIDDDDDDNDDDEPLPYDDFITDETDDSEVIEAEPVEPLVSKEAKVPMITVEHRIPQTAGTTWAPSAVEDIIRVQVPRATVFPNPAEPYTVAESNITLPDGIVGNYRISSTRVMLSENTVYVNWRLDEPRRKSGFFI
ncbi:MAG: hypothetical protein FWG25_05045 [Promicromonosporaceae bacterium]|nr:hypothetical protein [Promicromonosporaceae bacterium]